MSLPWLYPIAASVIGDSHLREGTDCQDAFDYCYSKDGQWLAIAVCDGAGSCTSSGFSSSFVSEKFSKELVKIADRLSERQFGAWVQDEILNSLLKIRRELRDASKTDDLSDFHTTLVALLLGPERLLAGRVGLTVHIGDGIIIGGDFTYEKMGSVCYLDEDLNVISPPKNGEYANETFFITEPQWIKNIRITPVNKKDWIILATDGGAAAFLNNRSLVQGAFLPSLFSQIVSSASKQDHSQILAAELSKAYVQAMTDDDKTIVLLLDPAKIPSEELSFSINPINGSQILQAEDIKSLDSFRSDGSAKPAPSNRMSLKGILRLDSRRKIIGLFVFAISIILGFSTFSNLWSQKPKNSSLEKHETFIDENNSSETKKEMIQNIQGNHQDENQ
jgi:serine/threonine protein phosphatase PrpC